MDARAAVAAVVMPRAALTTLSLSASALASARRWESKSLAHESSDCRAIVNVSLGRLVLRRWKTRGLSMELEMNPG